MIEIYECTDCKHCASFHSGYRVFCTNPALEPESVLDYHPVGDGNAENCTGFDSGNPMEFTWKQLEEAEEYSKQIDPEQLVTYQGILAWILMQRSPSK